jgi:molybdenum cofactor biosynthesis protein B
MISRSMKEVVRHAEVDAAIFCGGTGIAPSDITIETVTPFLDKLLPGFGEIFRHLSYDEIGSAAILSRAIAGIAQGKAVFCLPGSPNAVQLCLSKLIIPEAGHLIKHARE